MFLHYWLKIFLGLVLSHRDFYVLSSQTTKSGRSPYYRGLDPCPARCSDAGPSPGNWSLYHNLDQFVQCPETIFLDFSLSDEVDDAARKHRLYACSVWGADWTQTPNTTAPVSVTRIINSTYELGWWPAPGTGQSGGASTIAAVRALSRQMRWYLTNGHAPTNKPVYLFAGFFNAAVGLYVGKGLQNEGTGSTALKFFEDALVSVDPRTAAGGVALQLCPEGSDADHMFGVVASTNGTFSTTQSALTSLSHAECLSGFIGGMNITAQAYLVSPLVISSSNVTTNSSSIFTNTTSHLSRRTNCTTIQVVSGDSCASLASKCGISASDFTDYNPQDDLCSTLQPYQHVCCSDGNLPDFAPQPNDDGSCATYTIASGDTCSGLAAEYSLTVDDLEDFNMNTWAWNGCDDIWVGTIICLSTGDPPMPAPLANALCGPQVPGTDKPTDGTALSDLNPCLLNACCDVWGQCGTTSEFCTNTSTGAPGTAKEGTNGCISNCGTDIIFSGAPDEFRSVTYFESYGFDRPCLYMDAKQINTDKYTHVHYAFATLSDDYEVLTGDAMATYEFGNFKAIRGPKKIVTFGGWDFSTNPNTYYIFRNGVTAANRLTMATNIANFVEENGLDGVDIGESDT